MTDSPTPSEAHRLRLALLANLWLQGLIIVTGGLVRLTGSGLGCPTWPQCTPGSFTPVADQEEGWHTFVEFGNRLMTFVLAAAAVWVLVGAWRWARRTGRPQARSFARWAAVPLLGILAQAVVGGIIVLARLDPRTVSPHFLLSIGLVAFSAWLLHRYDELTSMAQPSEPGLDRPASAAVRALGWLAAGAFVIVVVLGTAVTGSGPHSGDAAENMRFGFDPLVTSRLHSTAVWVFVGCLVAIAVLMRMRPNEGAQVRRWWTWALVLSVAEGAIGYAQYFGGLPAALVATHMALSAVLTAVVTFAVAAAGTAAQVHGSGRWSSGSSATATKSSVR